MYRVRQKVYTFWRKNSRTEVHPLPSVKNAIKAQENNVSFTHQKYIPSLPLVGSKYAVKRANKLQFFQHLCGLIKYTYFYDLHVIFCFYKKLCKAPFYVGCMQKLYAYKNFLSVQFEKASQNLALEAVSSGTKWQTRDIL